MRDRRVTLAVRRWFPEGGMQRTLLRLAMELMTRGVRVRVVTTSWEGESPAGVDVHIVRSRGLTNHGKNEAFARAVGDLDREPGEILVGFLKMPGLDVYYAADPCFVERMDRRRFASLRRLLPRYRAFRRAEGAVFARGGKARILLFSPVQKPLYQRCWGTEEERIHLLPPGLDLERLERGAASAPDSAALRRELNIPERAAFLLTVGSGYQTKGVDRVFRLLAALPKAYAVIVGRDDTRRWKALAERYSVGERVRIMGPRDDVSTFYLAADLYVHPARLENTGSTLLEAMALGVPVVCSGVCGFADHVRLAKAGRVLAEPFCDEDFLHVVRGLIESDSERERLGARGVAYVADHDLTSLIPRAADVILAQSTTS